MQLETFVLKNPELFYINFKIKKKRKKDTFKKYIDEEISLEREQTANYLD